MTLKSKMLQERLEQNLKKSLPTGGLTMFIKGWKQKATPLGRQYCQLAVLARPIDATDCGLWPTPRSADGDKGVRSPEGYRKNMARYKNGVDLPTAMATSFGPQESTLGVVTANRASLNPAFPCWLMGFSTAALSSMRSAMQSFRKLQPSSSKQLCQYICQYKESPTDGR